MPTSLTQQLTVNGSPLSKGNGADQSIPDFATSTLHNGYSLDSIPAKLSVIPLNGNLPNSTSLYPSNIVEYKDNLPAGASI